MKPPSLGPTIRAARLGWHWSNRHGAFIRISTPDDMRNVIELAPVDDIPTAKLKGDHRRWWDSPEILDMIPGLSMVNRVKKYIRFEVDEHGEAINPKRI